MANEGPTPEECRRILLEQRDHMLRSAKALEGKLAGLDMAIAIVAEDIEQPNVGGSEDGGDVTDASCMTATRPHT